MQQKLLAFFFLFLPLWSCHVFAFDMQKQQVEQLLVDEQIKQQVKRFYRDLIAGDIERFNHSFAHLSKLQKEALRFLLIQKMEHNRRCLKPETLTWLKQQLAIRPTYMMVEQGGSYVVRTFAFDYPRTASRILRKIEKQQQQSKFILKAEKHKLVLSEWLVGEPHEIRSRCSVVLSELNNLTPEALDVIASQVINQSSLVWLPTTEVMSKLARTSQREDIYQILWKMRADRHVIDEVDRLTEMTATPFVIKQLISATNNPLLKQKALAGLARNYASSQDAQQFLLAKLNDHVDGKAVAIHLLNYSDISQLEKLSTRVNNTGKRNIQSALANNPIDS